MAHGSDSELIAKVSPNLGDPNGPPSSLLQQAAQESLCSEKYSSISLGFTRTQKAIAKTNKTQKTNSTPWV